jgi:hypothetical protein
MTNNRAKPPMHKQCWIKFRNFLSLLIIAISTSCTTGLLTSTINEKEEVAREWRDITLKGNFYGTFRYNQETYEKYEFCGFENDPTRILELWKPINKDVVLLREHRNYLLDGELPIIMEMKFYVQTNFKGVFYTHVNFAGDKIKEEKPLAPNLQNVTTPSPYDLYGNKNVPPPKAIDLVDPTLFLQNYDIGKFYRPNNNKWYLITTRVNQNLSLVFRKDTEYTLSTPKQNYYVDPNNLSYNERSWIGNKSMKTGYILTVPFDIVTTPIIIVGIGGVMLYKQIVN